jgi:hypothetical protein
VCSNLMRLQAIPYDFPNQILICRRDLDGLAGFVCEEVGR